MGTNRKKIFGQSDNKQYTACLNNYMEFSQLARYYLESANALIEITSSDSSKLDVYIYSAVFLYRHSVELWLKELIWMSNYLLDRSKTFPKHHKLIDLWRLLKNNAISLLTSDFPLNDKEIQYVETTFEEIMKSDPESDAFRYPIDKKTKRTHPNVTYVNVKSLYKQFNQIHDYLGQISQIIDSLYERRMEEDHQ